MTRGNSGNQTQGSNNNQSQTRLPNHKSRYERYYIPGGNLYLVAKGKHFCIHSYFFERESAYWKDLLKGLASLAPDVRKSTGLHEDDPLDVKEDPEHVADFLWVFYNQDYGSYTTVSLDKWINILRLSTKWSFPNVQGLALSYIDQIPADVMEVVEKIKLYQDCNVSPNHLLPLYVELATRERMLQREEFHVLDGDTLYAIVRARELLRAPVSVNPGADTFMSPIRPGFNEGAKLAVVASAFGISPQELQELLPSGKVAILIVDFNE